LDCVGNLTPINNGPLPQPAVRESFASERTEALPPPLRVFCAKFAAPSSALSLSRFTNPRKPKTLHRRPQRVCPAGRENEFFFFPPLRPFPRDILFTVVVLSLVFSWVPHELGPVSKTGLIIFPSSFSPTIPCGVLLFLFMESPSG